MSRGNQYLNTLYKLYHDITFNTPQTMSMDIPPELGRGRITQTQIKHGIILSDWKMSYQADNDLSVKGPVRKEYVQIIFCLQDGVSWENMKEHRSVVMHKKESCFYVGQGETESICYPKNGDFFFKSIKIPVNYFMDLLTDYFDGQELTAYRKKLLSGISKVSVTPMLEQLLSETSNFSQYRGGLGYLYLDGKVLELLSVYLGEILEVDILMGKETSLSRTERTAILEAKQVIDEQLAFAPSCEELSRIVHLSVPKLSKGFSSFYGMSIHQYIIDQRLIQAARLLLDGDWNVSEIATMVGYGKPSNFAAAFKKKYGVVPKNYRQAYLCGPQK